MTCGVFAPSPNCPNCSTCPNCQELARKLDQAILRHGPPETAELPRPRINPTITPGLHAYLLLWSDQARGIEASWVKAKPYRQYHLTVMEIELSRETRLAIARLAKREFLKGKVDSE